MAGSNGSNRPYGLHLNITRAGLVADPPHTRHRRKLHAVHTQAVMIRSTAKQVARHGIPSIDKAPRIHDNGLSLYHQLETQEVIMSVTASARQTNFSHIYP